MAFVCSFVDAVNQSVRIPGRKHPVWFEFSWRFGPLLVDVDGNPKAKQPIHEDDPFWPPFNAWLAEWEKTHPKPDDKPLPHASDFLDRRTPPKGSNHE